MYTAEELTQIKKYGERKALMDSLVLALTLIRNWADLRVADMDQDRRKASLKIIKEQYDVAEQLHNELSLTDTK